MATAWWAEEALIRPMEIDVTLSVSGSVNNELLVSTAGENQVMMGLRAGSLLRSQLSPAQMVPWTCQSRWLREGGTEGGGLRIISAQGSSKTGHSSIYKKDRYLRLEQCRGEKTMTEERQEP